MMGSEVFHWLFTVSKYFILFFSDVCENEALTSNWVLFTCTMTFQQISPFSQNNSRLCLYLTNILQFFVCSISFYWHYITKHTRPQTLDGWSGDKKSSKQWITDRHRWGLYYIQTLYSRHWQKELHCNHLHSNTHTNRILLDRVQTSIKLHVSLSCCLEQENNPFLEWKGLLSEATFPDLAI